VIQGRQRVHRTHNLKNLRNAKPPAWFLEQAKDCGVKERRSVQERNNQYKETKEEGMSVVKTDPKGDEDQYQEEKPN